MNPFFASQEEAVNHPRKNTNNRYKHFYHDIFHAGDINQFEEIYKREYTIGDHVENTGGITNVPEIPGVSPLFHNINGQDVFNTFSYIYHKFKKGIFVSIQKGKLETFLPFSNVNYSNEWSGRITFDPKIFQGQKYNGIVSKWYANNYLLRHEYPIAENDTSVAQYKYLLEKVCEKYSVPDIEFFINKRDFPLLKENLTEPYDEIWDSDNVPLISHNYSKYAPIFSPCKRDGFADILFPTPDDISRIGNLAGVYFRRDSRKFVPVKPPIINGDAKRKKWSEKIDLAVFRGSSTGRGCTIEDNPRLKLASLQEGNKGYINVGITKWNCRVKKLSGNSMLQKIEPDKFPFKLVEPLDYFQQSEYKYIIHVQGHTCAYRLSVELSLGCVLLIVQGKYRLWYSDLLQEYIHYVPVKEDLSNLIAQIDWCRKNKKKCLEMIKNCKKFYNEYLTENGILKYVFNLLVGVKQFTGSYIYPKSPLVSLYEKQWNSLCIPLNIPLLKYNNLIPNLTNKNRLDIYMISRPVFDIISNIISRDNSTIKIKDSIEKNTNKINYCEILESKYKTKPFDINELFIGKNCINNLIEKIPNFIYTIGTLDEKGEKGKKRTIQEYIPGMTFFEYLQRESNLQTIIKILIGILSAIQVAQNTCCFVHNDLYPWNIVLSPISHDTIIPYNIAYKTVYNISYSQGEFLPVIIDYNKSGGIYKGINYNIIDPSQNNISRDPYNLIISTFHTLLSNHKLEKWDYSTVYNICKIVWGGKGNLKQYLNDATKYEKMVSFKSEKISEISPVRMIQHLLGFIKWRKGKEWFHISNTYSIPNKIGLGDIMGNKVNDPEIYNLKNSLFQNYFYREFYKFTGKIVNVDISAIKNIMKNTEKNMEKNTEKWIRVNLWDTNIIPEFPTKYSYLSVNSTKNKNEKIGKNIKNIPQLYTLLIDALNYKGPYELSKNDSLILEKIYNSIDWEKQYILHRYNSIIRYV
jgi:hypothetical protein